MDNLENYKILPAVSPSQIGAVQSLLMQYWESFGFELSFQGFGAEVANLPGKYAPPAGRLALAMREGDTVGCIALRQVDGVRCEAKRLYVRDQFRGRGIASELLKWLISEARSAGYKHMLGDT